MNEIQGSGTDSGRIEQAPAPVGKPPETDELLLWAVACGLKPKDGWHRAISITQDEVMTLAEQSGERMQGLRLQTAIGAVIKREHLAQLLRARLAKEVLSATTIKDLVEAVRVFEKLPEAVAGDGQDRQSASAVPGNPDDLEDVDLEAAVAEAQRLLSDLGSEGAER